MFSLAQVIQRNPRAEGGSELKKGKKILTRDTRVSMASILDKQQTPFFQCAHFFVCELVGLELNGLKSSWIEFGAKHYAAILVT